MIVQISNKGDSEMGNKVRNEKSLLYVGGHDTLSIQSLTTLQQHTSDDGDDDAESIIEVLRYLSSLLSNVTSSDHTLPIVPLHTSLPQFHDK